MLADVIARNYWQLDTDGINGHRKIYQSGDKQVPYPYNALLFPPSQYGQRIEFCNQESNDALRIEGGGHC